MATQAEIHLDPARIIGEVNPNIYGGFIEHMGRCIYGGIYEPGSKLSDPKTGFRLDTLQAIKDLDVPVMRYPGGNFTSNYNWQDGIGPKESRPRKPELAWRTEESNQFGTDEFMAWCKEAGCEPYLCLNMGTGTLSDALSWLEYCNGTSNTYLANLRRKNGHEEPYKVKYWGLGNEVWGPWNVNTHSAEDYAKKAFEWGKAMKMLDPTIELVGCGETGLSSWDHTVLKKLAPIVSYHSIHIYTISRGSHLINCAGPRSAEKGIEIVKSLVDLARIENPKYVWGDRDEGWKGGDIKVCFDEWGVWDPVRAPGEEGAEERYDMSDALAVAAWLSVFVRKADIVTMANVAQSVNVISAIVTSPEGLYKQTTYWILWLFSKYMRGKSLDVAVKSPIYEGETVPPWLHSICGPTPYISCSAVLTPNNSINLSILNIDPSGSYSIPVKLSHVEIDAEEVEVFEIWNRDLKVKNDFENPERVKVVQRKEEVKGEKKGEVVIEVKAASFVVVVLPLRG